MELRDSGPGPTFNKTLKQLLIKGLFLIGLRCHHSPSTVTSQEERRTEELVARVESFSFCQ
jgi:hypothetical protein